MTTAKNNEHKKLNFSNEQEQSQACLNSAEHEKNQGRKVLNVPNLRFPEFQGEWEKCILGDITENFNLRNKDKIQYPMFSVTNDRGFVPQSEQFEGRDMVGEDIKAYKIIHTNDFAYNPARINVGSIAIYTGEKPCMISSLYVCFKTTKEVNNEWLMQLLKTPKMNYYYNVNGEGGVRVYLFYPNFARIRMSIPKIEEQKKIAKLLNLLDERIATQNKIIEDLKKLKSAIIEIEYTPNTKTTSHIGDVIEQISKRNKNNAIKNVLSVSNRQGFIKQSDQ
uniref:restriction endonuclease subunit S n=1 Tax=Prevotella sp. TaxID=59823 RepID=UPI0040268695